MLIQCASPETDLTFYYSYVVDFYDGIGYLVTFDLKMLTVDCFTEFKSEFNLNLDSTLRMEAGKVRFGWVF